MIALKIRQVPIWIFLTFFTGFSLPIQASEDEQKENPSQSSDDHQVPELENRPGTVNFEVHQTPNPNVLAVRLRRGYFQWSNFERQPATVGDPYLLFFLCGIELLRYLNIEFRMPDHDRSRLMTRGPTIPYTLVTLPHSYYLFNVLNSILGFGERLAPCSGILSTTEFITHYIDGRWPMAVPPPNTQQDVLAYQDMVHDQINHVFLHILTPDEALRIVRSRIQFFFRFIQTSQSCFQNNPELLLILECLLKCGALNLDTDQGSTANSYSDNSRNEGFKRLMWAFLFGVDRNRNYADFLIKLRIENYDESGQLDRSQLFLLTFMDALHTLMDYYVDKEMKDTAADFSEAFSRLKKFKSDQTFASNIDKLVSYAQEWSLSFQIFYMDHDISLPDNDSLEAIYQRTLTGIVARRELLETLVPNYVRQVSGLPGYFPREEQAENREEEESSEEERVEENHQDSVRNRMVFEFRPNQLWRSMLSLLFPFWRIGFHLY